MPKLPHHMPNIFSDSPLRRTSSAPVAIVPAEPEPATTLVRAQAQEAAATRETKESEPAPPSAQEAKKPPPPNIKVSVYITKQQQDALEAAVYKRRRAGERIGVSDLYREVIDLWIRENPEFAA